jgi:Tat protein translocase TatC
MSAAKKKGEMPFLDHLEELRWRILWSLAAVGVGSIVGFVLVQQFDILGLLKEPILPFLPEGKLFITRPTDAFILTLKLAFTIGLVLAAPVVFAQVWSFLTPALYKHEKRYIVPALIAGVGLFTAGVLMAYLWVLPAALRFLLRFQRADLESIITANEYLGFALQFMIAFGLVFQLPIFIVMLSALGLIQPETFARHRPIALVIASVLAALITPPDIISMVLMMMPIIVLYEVGILIARIVRKRKRDPRIGAALLLAAVVSLWPGSLAAQEPVRPPPRDTVAGQLPGDTLPRPLDTAAARRLGLPSAPTRSFPTSDSVLQELLRLEGYMAIRYAADSITLFGETREVLLSGAALVERERSILEADTVSFLQAECRLRARGDPALFEEGTVLVGAGMQYNTCDFRGIVSAALTSFEQSGVTWYLRGGIGIDSASVRVYGGSSSVTSCDLPTPHYHFQAGRVKWVSNTIMVARPAVLYVQDVPILWLPFIFQDMRQGRRSGFLIPRFGVADLVRPNQGYQRAVSNIGYYFALTDYLDVQASFDWFSGNYKAVNGQLRYRWLNRFLSGGVSVSRIFESGVDDLPGANSLRLQWNHQQSFDARTRFTASVDYATSARVVQRNTVDPLVQTANLDSRGTFNKQFSWGTLSLGGSRSQDLSNGGVSQTLPSLSLTPRPIDIGDAFTWSPSFSLTNSQTFDQTPGAPVFGPPVGGLEQIDTILPDTRNTQISFRTPLRIGRWNWQNDMRLTDFKTTRPPSPITLPDPDNPDDSVTLFFSEDFRTEFDWNTGINLPTLFPSTWKIQPSLGIRNTTSGPFLLRNRFTNGGFVSQGKRFSFGAGVTPSVFGFFPGFGPIQRIRHTFSPLFSWSYAPSAMVPEAFARALDPTGRSVRRESPTVHAVTASLFQTFEAKLKPPADDTAGQAQPRKLKLLTIQTSGISYDFVQAKEEGRTGWTTQTLTNRFTSDLLPGFTISTTHDLWDGPVGFDTTGFDPFLTSMSARFSLTGRTIAGILSLITGKEAPPEEGPQPGGVPSPEEFIQPAGTGLGPRPGLDPTIERLGSRPPGRAGFRAAVSYDERRTRPLDDTTQPGPTRDSRTLGFNISFQPTTNWSVSWNTQYNFTTKEFGQHVVRLDRDLHRWRATFSFVKAPNGNVAFNFFVSLLDQPEIKFQYDQRSVSR